MSENKKIRLVQRVEFIKNICQGKKVLHLGCTSYPYTMEMLELGEHLHLHLKENAGELYGLDYDQKGIDILKEKGVENLFRGDLEKLDEVELDEKFDVIIAGEMIEHLNNPGLFLDGVKRFMNRRFRFGHHDDQCLRRTSFCGLFFDRKRRNERGGASRSRRILFVFDLEFAC